MTAKIETPPAGRTIIVKFVKDLPPDQKVVDAFYALGTELRITVIDRQTQHDLLFIGIAHDGPFKGYTLGFQHWMVESWEFAPEGQMILPPGLTERQRDESLLLRALHEESGFDL